MGYDGKSYRREATQRLRRIARPRTQDERQPRWPQHVGTKLPIASEGRVQRCEPRLLAVDAENFPRFFGFFGLLAVDAEIFPRFFDFFRLFSGKMRKNEKMCLLGLLE